MMTLQEIETATRDQLISELAAACEYTEDADACGLGDLQARVRQLLATHAEQAEVDFGTQLAAVTEYRRDGDADWEPLTEAPPPVRAAITEEIAEACYDRRDDAAETGVLAVGGAIWEYRRRSETTNKIPDGDYFIQPEGERWYAARFRGGKLTAGSEESEAATHQAANDSWAGVIPADDDVEVPEWLALEIIDQVAPGADPEFIVVTRPAIA